MKPANYGPVYCALYPEFAEIARKHGYAMAIHGSLAKDLDIICIPWVDSPSEPQAVVDEITGSFDVREIGAPETRHHGRLIYTVSVGHGHCALDLSFMPRAVLSATPCTMGAGCDEAGVCYAAANDQPERCPKAVSKEPEPLGYVQERALSDLRDGDKYALIYPKTDDPDFAHFNIPVFTSPAPPDGMAEALREVRKVLEPLAEALEDADDEADDDEASALVTVGDLRRVRDVIAKIDAALSGKGAAPPGDELGQGRSARMTNPPSGCED